MTTAKLRRVAASDVQRATQDAALNAETLSKTAEIVEQVRSGGDDAVRGFGVRFGELDATSPLWISRDELLAAANRIGPADVELFKRVTGRVTAFAEAQRMALTELDVAVPGGRAGHTLEPIERAGCYIPGGRYPLPSTAIMTVAVARAAGCASVIAASPRPGDHVLAAAGIAGADGLLTVGGAHAIAALAYGTGSTAPADIIVGPGNRWVTAAKHIVSRSVGIDMLAGPSELLVLADDSADAGVIAADLLGQAEHDDLAQATLVTPSARLADAVDIEIAERLPKLDSEATAAAALQHGRAVIAADLDEAIEVTNRLAPEHLEIHTRDAGAVTKKIRHAGAVFIGQQTAEVFGDFGHGPNHTLPTGGGAKSTAGLSVLTFLRARTWLRLDHAQSPEGTAAIEDAVRMAEIEGLPGHRASAAARLGP